MNLILEDCRSPMDGTGWLFTGKLKDPSLLESINMQLLQERIVWSIWANVGVLMMKHQMKSYQAVQIRFIYFVTST